MGITKMTAQLELVFEEEVRGTACVEYVDLRKPGEYAVVSEICADGFYLFERCYIHEVLPDGYLVEICEGMVWGKPWSKDGDMIHVSFSGLSDYRHEIHYGIGAHYIPTVDEIVRIGSFHAHDTHSRLV